MNSILDRSFLAAVEWASKVPLDADGNPTEPRPNFIEQEQIKAGVPTTSDELARLKAEREREFHRSQPSYQDAEF